MGKVSLKEYNLPHPMPKKKPVAASPPDVQQKAKDTLKNKGKANRSSQLVNQHKNGFWYSDVAKGHIEAAGLWKDWAGSATPAKPSKPSTPAKTPNKPSGPGASAANTPAKPPNPPGSKTGTPVAVAPPKPAGPGRVAIPPHVAARMAAVAAHQHRERERVRVSKEARGPEGVHAVAVNHPGVNVGNGRKRPAKTMVGSGPAVRVVQSKRVPMEFHGGPRTFDGMPVGKQGGRGNWRDMVNMMNKPRIPPFYNMKNNM